MGMQTATFSSLDQACNLPPCTLPARVAPPQPRRTRGAGDWHYRGAPRRNHWYALAASIIISGGLHAGLLFGFNHHAKAAKRIAAPKEELIQMAMPDTKDPDEPPPADSLEDTNTPPAVDVPSLVDLPSVVDITVGFVQPLDTRPPLQADLASSKVAVVPVNIAHGPRSAGGLKNIFDLSQLDRIPEVVSQVAPQFPSAMKRDYTFAQVVIEFIVDTNGDVRGATVVQSTAAGFDESAIEGVSRWHFRPGMKGGRKVNTRMRVPIRFQVTEGED